MNLRELQTTLQNYLLSETNSANDAALHNLTLSTPTFSRSQRLGIYHEAYRLRLIDALRNDFPALEKILGEEIFTTLMNAYIDAHPSQHPSLRWLGEKLHPFLQQHTEWKNETAILELAAFEWAQTMAFDAADEKLATVDDVRALQNTQWLGLQLQFHSSLQRLDLNSNAPEIWQSIIKNDIQMDAHLNDDTQHWLIWRKDLQVVYRKLDKPEYWALQEFLANKNFSNVCECLCQWFVAEQVPMQAAQYLQHWLQNGLVTNIVTAIDVTTIDATTID